MTNPFRVDVSKGYHWWTCGIWDDSLKIGPLSIAWFQWQGHTIIEFMVLGRAPFFRSRRMFPNG